LNIEKKKSLHAICEGKKIRKILTFPLINVRVQPGCTTLEVTAGVELIPKLIVLDILVGGPAFLEKYVRKKGYF
jgi:hypothetical protein